MKIKPWYNTFNLCTSNQVKYAFLFQVVHADVCTHSCISSVIQTRWCLQDPAHYKTEALALRVSESITVCFDYIMLRLCSTLFTTMSITSSFFSLLEEMILKQHSHATCWLLTACQQNYVGRACSHLCILQTETRAIRGISLLFMVLYVWAPNHFSTI